MYAVADMNEMDLADVQTRLFQHLHGLKPSIEKQMIWPAK